MSSNCYKLFSVVFDVIGACIALLDLTTDIIILITWYYQDRMIFFWISLSILIAAHLSYVAIFYYNHGDTNNICKSTLSILFTLPFAPCLSFIFYFVSTQDSYLREFINKYGICFHFEWSSYSFEQEQSRQAFLANLMFKHLGFITEALIEAFPQSILQLIVIVYYNEPNMISIISILLSMISVSTKMLLVQMGDPFGGWKYQLWSWWCFITDFFSAFFIASFIFYTPNNEELQSYFLMLQTMYLWQFLICILPFAVIISLGHHFYWTLKLSMDYSESTIGKILIFPLYFCGVTIVWMIGLFLLLLAMEMFCTFNFGFIVVGIACSQRVSSFSSLFYEKCVKWILNVSGDERILRICAVNKIIMEQHPEIKAAECEDDKNKEEEEMDWKNYFDAIHYNYLENMAWNQFDGVTLKELRNHQDGSTFIYEVNPTQGNNRKPYSVWTVFWYQVYGEHIMDCYTELKEFRKDETEFWFYLIKLFKLICLTFIAGPLYLFSRIFNIFCPLFIVLYLYIYGDGINLFIDVATFQVTMWIIYVLLVGIWFVLTFIVIKDEYYAWHILPSTYALQASTEEAENDRVYDLIEDYCAKMKFYQTIKNMFIDKFGIDITHLMLHYLDCIEITD